MSIQKINIGGEDVEIEDASARTNISNLTSEVNTLDGRVTTLENNSGGGGGGSEWVELTTDSTQEAEITQKFSEIRMAIYCNDGNNFSTTYNFDNSIFHNTKYGPLKYFICGYPTQIGCTFLYRVSNEGKQYVSVHSCYIKGNAINNYTFKAWVKPTANKQ